MTKFEIDEQQIRKLAKLLHETGLSEIEVTEGELRLRLVRTVSMIKEEGVSSQPEESLRESGQQQTSKRQSTQSGHSPGTILSPMVGMAYIAAEPGGKPFVVEGQSVQENQTLLIIEAMKVMNPIRAPKTGTVTKIFVHDSCPVEYGEPLMVIE